MEPLLGLSSWGNHEVAGDSMQPRGMKLRLHNLTAFGQKTWAYLDEMQDTAKPDVIAVVETHLMGVHLNRSRRKATSLGWHFFATPAIATKNALEHASQKVFANHGGEGFLVQPHVEATGYHQDADTIGFRSIIVTMMSTSLHLIVVYFDHSIGLDAGPNTHKAQ